MDALSIENLTGLIETVSAWGLKVLGGIAILVVGLLAARLGAKGVERMAASTLDHSLARLLGRLAYYSIISIVAISVFGIVGIETASLITVLGASSLAIGLALQGSLGNLASGFMLMLFRPYRAGDYVQIGDNEGWVTDVGVFSTHLDTLDHVRVVLPNAHVGELPIRNWTTNGTRRLDLELEIAIDSALPRAREALEAMLAADPLVLSDPAPQVAVSEFGDTSASLVVRPWCSHEHYWDLRFSLPEKLKDAIEAAGCTLPCPQRQIRVQRDGQAA